MDLEEGSRRWGARKRQEVVAHKRLETAEDTPREVVRTPPVEAAHTDHSRLAAAGRILAVAGHILVAAGVRTVAARRSLPVGCKLVR